VRRPEAGCHLLHASPQNPDGYWEPRAVVRLQVAASLARRDAMPPAEALLLWLRHVIKAERAPPAACRGMITKAPHPPADAGKCGRPVRAIHGVEFRG
jgi:hypothetical protein